MVVSLTKSALRDALPNRLHVECPRCRVPYILSDEWHRLKDWTRAAVRVLRQDHSLTHERDTLELVQKKLVRGR